MLFSKATLAALALAGSAVAQNMSLCDKYTGALFKDNTPANQEKLLTALVNTAVLGNKTASKDGVTVNGILNPGMYMGYSINLLGYFDGGLADSNNNGTAGAVNYLDGGGAVPLNMGKPASDTTSNQYMLLTHLYSYFGILLGCTGVGKDGFPAYGGVNSQYEVHQYMALDQYQIGYFITQVGTAAAYYGVSKDDITTVGNALNKLFNYKCSPPTEIIPGTGKVLNSICIADSCPLDPMGNCTEANYMNATLPQTVNATLAGNSTNVTDSSGNDKATAIPTTTMMASGTKASGAASASSAAGVALRIGETGAGLLVGAVAFAFAL